MNINKAIELLSESANMGTTTFDQDFKDAELLGIEALKAIRDFRKDWSGNRFDLLKGENRDLKNPPYTEAFGRIKP